MMTNMLILLLPLDVQEGAFRLQNMEFAASGNASNSSTFSISYVTNIYQRFAFIHKTTFYICNFKVLDFFCMSINKHKKGVKEFLQNFCRIEERDVLLKCRSPKLLQVESLRGIRIK